jgi:hypothetical protein
MKNLDQPTTYRIKVQGHLDEHWSEWFDGMAVTHDEHDDTVLTGQVADQSALYGLLNKMRDIGLPLLLVERVQDEVTSERESLGSIPRSQGDVRGKESEQNAVEQDGVANYACERTT